MRGLIETLWQDVRYTFRMLRRTPAFVTIALLSLALGIGANTAIFSLINALMLRQLPVKDPQQLIEFLQRYPGEPRGNGFWSWGSFQHFRDNNHAFSGLIGFAPTTLSLRAEGIGTETVDGQYVAGDFFPMLGVRPAIGRLIGPQDDSARSAGVVISWSYWQSRFGLDPAIRGRQIFVNDAPAAIVGVAPPQFSGLAAWSKPQVWLPAVMEPMISHITADHLRLALVARLKPAASIEQAPAEMTVLYRFTVEERAKASKDPLIRRLRIEVEPAGAGLSLLRDQFSKPLLMLLALVGLLLLIACINLASLLLARGVARQSEMALRVSLGARPLRLARQVLTESLLLSALGTLLGVGFAYFGANVLVRILASGRQVPGLPSVLKISIQPDVHVLLFTAGLALLSGTLFGLVPTLHAWATGPMSSLRDAGKASNTKFRSAFWKGLVIAQVAFSVALLSAAGLFIRNLANLEQLNVGFRRDHLLLVTLDATHSGYKPEQLSRSYQELVTHLDAIPGVRSATLSAGTPLSGAGASKIPIVEGHPERPQDRRYISLAWVAPKYFETLGIPLLMGRTFTSVDQNQARVAIINQSMARYYFANENALGKHIAFEHDWASMEGKSYEIVGVVGDAKYYEIREAAPRTVYLNAFQDGSVPSDVILRTAVFPTAVVPEVRRIVRELLKTVAVANVTTMAEQVDSSIIPERLIATLSGLFGALGSLLAAIGLYGLLAYTVARRLKEIGIRMALGATRSSVLRMVLGDALLMVFAGLAIGAFTTLWGKRLAASLIADLPLKSATPLVFGVLAMIAIALFAAYVPARRATSLDPMEVLRHE
jgi:predicted permease